MLRFNSMIEFTNGWSDVLRRTILAFITVIFFAACGSSDGEDAFREAVEVSELDIVDIRIEIDSGNDTLQDGTTDRARAIATRSGGQPDLDVSTEVNWSSSDSSVMTVDNIGNISAQPGIDSSATIFAEIADLSATQVLNVSTADLISIDIEGAPSNVSVCSFDHQLTALGDYGDVSGEPRNISSLVDWTTTVSADIATIDSNGLVDTFGSGTADFDAAFDGVNASDSSITTIIIDDDLDEIVISPNTASVEAGSNRQFTATARYDDTSSLNINSTATWISDNPAVLTITSPGGVARGIAEGTANIEASCNNTNPEVSEEVLVTVTAEVTADRVFISRDSDEGPLTFDVDDSPIQLRAFLEFTNNSVEEITTNDNGSNDEINWSVTAASPLSGVAASIANDGNNKGDLTFNAEGETEIRIVYDRNGRTFEDDITIIVRD